MVWSLRKLTLELIFAPGAPAYSIPLVWNMKLLTPINGCSQLSPGMLTRARSTVKSVWQATECRPAWPSDCTYTILDFNSDPASIAFKCHQLHTLRTHCLWNSGRNGDGQRVYRQNPATYATYLSGRQKPSTCSLDNCWNPLYCKSKHVH